MPILIKKERNDISFIKLSSKLGNKSKYNGKKGIMPASILQLNIVSNI